MSVSDEATVKNDITSWKGLLKALEGYDAGWAFRGACSADWQLRTSLERLEVTQAVYQAERYLLNAFQRRVHHYISDPPKTEDELEWLALMQHHGAPTRLLDWTKSPYVALFFALEPIDKISKNAALWVIDLEWCKEQATQVATPMVQQVLEPGESLGKPGIFSMVFLREQANSLDLVAPLQPYRMNQRLVIQQGLFLCPGNPVLSFEDNLLAFRDHEFRDHVHKLIIPRHLRLEILGELNKMNITRASLFPGIDGFAQSLGLNVEVATKTGRLSQELQKLSIYSEYGFL